MLRVTGFAFMFAVVVFSEEFECFDDSDCIRRFGIESKCTKQKRGPSCALVNRCTNPEYEWDYQSCDCKHLHKGMCRSDTSILSCSSVVQGVCPEREGMKWECCIPWTTF